VRPIAVLLAAAAALLGGAAPAAGEATVGATVLHAVDGDTLDVLADNGVQARVRLIGVDAPETKKPGTPVACGGREAAAYVERLEGRRVVLVGDPSQDTTDRYGRLLAYVELPGGRDVGRELLAAGLAEVYVFGGRPFARLPAYRAAAGRAREARRGVFGACGGDFHRAGQARRQDAEAHVRRFYARLDERRFDVAWGMLSAGLRDRLGSYRSWRKGFRRTLDTRVNRVRAVVLADGRAVVRAAIRARDRDACSGRAVKRFFRVRWVLERRGGGWLGTDVTGRKVGGARVRLSRADCPRPKPRRPAPRARPDRGSSSGCHPSYRPCVPLGRDYDCGELDGPYAVVGPDEYRLDGDGDGTGCDAG
jgi:micrococcal nuclease